MNRQGDRGDRRRLLTGGAHTDAATPPADFAPADELTETDAHAAAVRSLGQSGVMGVTTADVGAHRERMRQGKLRKLALILTPFAVWFVVRATVLHRGPFGFPHIPSGLGPYIPGFFLIRHPGIGDDYPAVGGGALTAHPVPTQRDRRALRRRARRARRGRRSGQDPQPLPGPQDLRRAHGRVGPARHPLRGATGDGQDLSGQGHGGRSRRALPVRVVVGVPVHVLRTDEPQDPLVLPGDAQVRPP